MTITRINFSIGTICNGLRLKANLRFKNQVSDSELEMLNYPSQAL